MCNSEAHSKGCMNELCKTDSPFKAGAYHIVEVDVIVFNCNDHSFYR